MEAQIQEQPQMKTEKKEKAWKKRLYQSHMRTRPPMEIEVRQLAAGAYLWRIKVDGKIHERVKNVLPPSDIPWRSWRIVG